jgi:hypothetical protein
MSENTAVPWYSEGMDDAEKEAKKQGSFTPFRFWMRPNTSTQITFVTDLPFSYYEHQVKINGRWQNWFTCKRKDCPLCKAGNQAAKMYAWVIVDHTAWSDKKGNQHKDEVRLFVCKAKPALRLKKLREKNGGLRGLRVEVERTGAGFSYSTGDQIDAEEKYSEDTIKTLRWWPKQKKGDKGENIGRDWGAVTTETWIEVFEPKDNDELKRIVRGMADEPDEERSKGREDEGGSDDSDGGDVDWK